MKELIEKKIQQLQTEATSVRNLIFQAGDSITKLKQQKASHELNLSKLLGAIEAFQATLNAMNEESKKEAPSGSINGDA